MASADVSALPSEPVSEPAAAASEQVADSNGTDAKDTPAASVGPSATPASGTEGVSTVAKIVVFIAAFCGCLVNGHGYVGGLFINPVSAEYGVEKSVAALANSVSFFFWSLGSVLAGRGLEYYGLRPIVAASFFLCVLGPLLASFSPNITLFIVFWAGFCGFGCAFVYMAALAIVPDYFTGRQGMIYGLLLAGASLGSITLLAVVQAALEAHSWQWAMRMLAAIYAALMAVSVAALVKRTPSLREQYIKSMAEAKARAAAATAAAAASAAVHALHHELILRPLPGSGSSGSHGSPPHASRALAPAISDLGAGALDPIVPAAGGSKAKDKDKPKAAPAAATAAATATPHAVPARPPLFEWSLFRVRAFVVFLIPQTLLSFYYYAPFVYMSVYAEDQGLSSTAAAATLVVMSSTAICGRFGLGFCCDMFGPWTVMHACVGVYVLALGAWYWCSSAGSLTALAAVFGLVSGGSISATTALQAVIVGKERASGSLGLIYGIAWLPGAAAAGYLIAYCKEASGSYAAATFAMAAMAALSMVFNVITQRYVVTHPPQGSAAAAATVTKQSAKTTLIAPAPAPAAIEVLAVMPAAAPAAAALAADEKQP